MIKNDDWIKSQAAKGMITPFEPTMIRKLENDVPALSYGTGSYGYDIRLSPKDFRVFRHVPGLVLDPKNFDPQCLKSIPLQSDRFGDFFVMPRDSYGLGVALERLVIPDNITAICLGKSTYARCAVIANVTPGEASFPGHLTLEFMNNSANDLRIYANEGIIQLVFFEGDPCLTTYSDRKGKYRDQPEMVVLPKI
jgi:dCTP deaminase